MAGQSTDQHVVLQDLTPLLPVARPPHPAESLPSPNHSSGRAVPDRTITPHPAVSFFCFEVLRQATTPMNSPEQVNHHQYISSFMSCGVDGLSRKEPHRCDVVAETLSTLQALC
jgi:hypothetical protein